MKVQRIRVPGRTRLSWLVLDEQYLIVEPIRAFLAFRERIGLAPTTVRGDAHHLKLFWEYLSRRGTDWREMDIARLAAFIPWLRSAGMQVPAAEAQRTDATIDQILSTVHEFYGFHGRLGSGPDLPLYRFVANHRSRYKPFLYGIAKSTPARRRLITVRREKRLPKTVTREHVQQLLAACHHLRDRLLVGLLYDTGIRIGQALGLRHGDISVERGELRIEPRDDNVNGARAKRREPLTVYPSAWVLDLYVRYIVEELDGLLVEQLPDYVFVNLWQAPVGRPMTYPAIAELFDRLSQRLANATGTAIHVMPHMLRHTRATEWIRDDQLPLPTVSRLLGHQSVVTTHDTYVHLTVDDLHAELDAVRRRRERTNEP